MQSRLKTSGLVVALSLLAWAAPAQAQTDVTKLLVRVTAHDAKIIGSGVGGARVTVRNAHTGETLAQGVQQGSTGNTDKIMREPRKRGATVFDTEGAAGYVAEIRLDRPSVVEIVAEGPLGTPHAMQRATKTLLVVPGQHVLGEGIVIELLGFTVALEAPTSGAQAGQSFEVRANVTMLCGCPTEPGGLWDANDIEIVARAVRNGTVVFEGPLSFAGTTSTYTGAVALFDPGEYQLQVLAMDPKTGNFGMAAQDIVVR
jgi:hypothetical protein